MLKLAIYVSVPLLLGLMGFILMIGERWRLPFVKRLPFLAVYCVLVTFFSPTIALHVALCSIIVPLFARKRDEIVPIFVFAMLLVPSIGFTASVGSLKLLPVTGFTTLALGAAVWSMVHGKRGESRSFVAELCVGALYIVLVVAGARATSFTNWMRVAFDLSLLMLVPFFVVRRCVKSAYDARLVMIGLIAATASLSAVAIYEANAHWPLFRAVYGHYGIELSQGAGVKLRGGFIRSAGPFIEPTSFALWLTLGTGALLASRWLFRTRLSYAAMAAFLLVGLFAPQSRGAWLGLIVLYAAFQTVNGRSVSLVKPAFFAFFAGLLIYGTGLVVPRVGNMLGLNTAGVVQRDYRQDLFTRGLEEARHNLLLGTDMRRVVYALRDLVQGEGQVDFVNSYLYVLLATGLIGLTLFAFSLFSPLMALIVARKRAPLEDRAAMAFVIAALGSIAIMIAFTAIGSRTIMGIVILLGLTGGLMNVRPSSKARSAPAEDDERPRERHDVVRIGGMPASSGAMIDAS